VPGEGRRLWTGGWKEVAMREWKKRQKFWEDLTEETPGTDKGI